MLILRKIWNICFRLFSFSVDSKKRKKPFYQIFFYFCLFPSIFFNIRSYRMKSFSTFFTFQRKENMLLNQSFDKIANSIHFSQCASTSAIYDLMVPNWKMCFKCVICFRCKYWNRKKKKWINNFSLDSFKSAL